MWEQNVIAIEFELFWKNVSEMTPQNDSMLGHGPLVAR